MSVSGAVGALPGGVCETRVCGRGRATLLHLRPRGGYGPTSPAPPFHLPSLLSSIPEPLPHPPLHLPPLPSPPTLAAWLPSPYQLSPSFSLPFSLLSLQLPADRVRQVHPVLRAPGPPSTSNQIPPIPRRPPFPSLPGWLFCDLTVAPQPQNFPSSVT